MQPIKRSKPTSDESPPWAGMKFTQPVDSDALAEYLKKLYPQCATLRERKHMAAIDFLRRELEMMQCRSLQINPTSPQLSLISSDIDEENSSQESRSPSTAFSSLVERPEIAENSSYALESQAPLSSNSTTKNRINNTTQEFIFSAFDGRTLQPKRKRKMTEEEKKDYKRTRERGACAKCKRQKEKVPHERLGWHCDRSLSAYR